MASSRKPKEEEQKKKSISSSGKAAEATITPEKKNGVLKKPRTPKSNNRSRNGTVYKFPTPPSPRSESEESEPERDQSRSNKTNNQGNKTPEAKKRKQKGKANEDDDDEEAKICRFPMNRIKRIMKSGDCTKAISEDAIFMVNKATEKFLERFCDEAYRAAVKDRKKSLAYKHLSSVVSKRERYEFLSDFVPEKITAEDALKEAKSSELG